MQRYLPIMFVALGVAGCAPGYMRASVVYAEPAEYVYVVPMDRVVVVTIVDGRTSRSPTAAE